VINSLIPQSLGQLTVMVRRHLRANSPMSSLRSPRIASYGGKALSVLGVSGDCVRPQKVNPTPRRVCPISKNGSLNPHQIPYLKAEVNPRLLRSLKTSGPLAAPYRRKPWEAH